MCDNGLTLLKTKIVLSQFNKQDIYTQLDAINKAAEDGDLKTLKYLHTELLAQHNGFIEDQNLCESLQTQPITSAALHNHVECVQFLLPYSDLNSEWCLAFVYAAENGHVECVKLLLPHTSEKTIFQVMVAAAYYQKWDCVDAILSYVDPKWHKDFREDLEITLLWASRHQQYDLLQRLYPLCNIDSALQYAKERWNDMELLALTDYHNSLQQNKLLREVVEHTPFSRRSKI